MIPENNVYITGQGTVGGDALNTFVQTCFNVAGLRNFIGIGNMVVVIQGTNFLNDGGQGQFIWNDNGTAPDDNGATTVIPYGVGLGNWTRVPALPLSQLGPNVVFTGLAQSITTVSTSLVMVGLGMILTPRGSGTVRVTFDAQASCSEASHGFTVELRYGSVTGTPPSAGNAATGNLLGLPQDGLLIGSQIEGMPVSIDFIGTNLQDGVAYYFDAAFLTDSATNGVTLNNIMMTAQELNS